MDSQGIQLPSSCFYCYLPGELSVNSLALHVLSLFLLQEARLRKETGYEHLKEDLHIIFEAEDVDEAAAVVRIKRCRTFLVPYMQPTVSAGSSTTATRLVGIACRVLCALCCLPVPSLCVQSSSGVGSLRWLYGSHPHGSFVDSQNLLRQSWSLTNIIPVIGRFSYA